MSLHCITLASPSSVPSIVSKMPVAVLLSNIGAWKCPHISNAVPNICTCIIGIKYNTWILNHYYIICMVRNNYVNRDIVCAQTLVFVKFIFVKWWSVQCFFQLLLRGGWASPPSRKMFKALSKKNLKSSKNVSNIRKM